MIEYSKRQVRFQATDKCNPHNLQRIADRFKVGNSRACHFALFYVYGIKGKELKPIIRYEPLESRAIFLYFEPNQMTRAESLAVELGISFSELCKRAIYLVSGLIENHKLRMDDPKVKEFFPE